MTDFPATFPPFLCTINLDFDVQIYALYLEERITNLWWDGFGVMERLSSCVSFPRVGDQMGRAAGGCSISYFVTSLLLPTDSDIGH